MNRHELADLLLKTLIVFDFLQFVDEGFEKGDPHARGVVNGFLSIKSNPAVRDAILHVLPFVQLETTLSILMVTACFASRIREDGWSNLGLSIKPEYHVRWESPEGTLKSPTFSDVIRTMRNASAHLPDFFSADGSAFVNVSFDTGCVSFASQRPRSRLTFETPDGFVEFLRDYLRAVRKLVAEKLLDLG